MARQLRINYPGAFYHVTSRGNEQKAVFKSKRDREKFLEYLETATLRYDAVVHVYCLMDNHYHLLLETPSGNLPQIMRHINGAYTTYFNVPVAEREYKKFISSLEGKEYESPLKEVFASTILGDTGFIEYVKKSFVKDREADKQIPATKVLMEKASMEEILKCVDREFAEGRVSRDVKQYLCHRYTSERLKKIGEQFKVSESAVSHAVRRASKTIAKDKKVRKKVDYLIGKLKLSRFKT